MINMVQNAKEQAAALAMAAYQAAVADGTLPQAEVKTAPVEIPKETANGDFTTTFALAASKALRKSPRDIAQALLGHMNLEGTYFASAEIAGPGFLNFRLNDSWYAGVCDAVEQVLSGSLDLVGIAALPDDELISALEHVKGVGVKVANCVALFAYGRTACAPVDTWIKKIIRQEYQGRDPVVRYGDTAGIMQQYFFYYAQNHKSETA